MADIPLYPLTFNANIHTALWGAESWEISGHASSPSTVAEGPLAGCTLEELAAQYGRALMGAKAPSETVFPLLFKVIDAKQRLSVQVHPNEETRALTGGEPKTEMWRVLGGKGPIFAGLKPGTTPAVVEENVRTGRFEETLVRHDAREGLTLFIPGGLVHAIGEDVLIYEVQQSSNTTYRLYDWGRVGADGKPSITWEPDKSKADPPRTYTTYGKANLLDKDWTPVTDANRATMHFFKVGVEIK